MSDIDALVETVREGVACTEDKDACAYCVEAFAALSELAGIAREGVDAETRARGRLLELQAAEGERDAADAMWRAENDRARTAEGERDRLKDALREIASRMLTRRLGIHMDGKGQWPTPLHEEIYELARAALADVGGTEETSA